MRSKGALSPHGSVVPSSPLAVLGAGALGLWSSSPGSPPKFFLFSLPSFALSQDTSELSPDFSGSKIQFCFSMLSSFELSLTLRQKYQENKYIKQVDQNKARSAN